ncbi:MAG: hypothetical protein NTW29_18400 [Bacteroidetes bacterium]|nr:hypothetical protein [Bacteroidota bacterium]
MAEEYHIRVIKEYAASLIEHLRNEDAIEFIEAENSTVPEWQQQATREALQQIKDNPSSLLSWDTIKGKYLKQ